MSVTRHLAPATARRLLRNAGPPIPWDLAALVPGALIVAAAVAIPGGVRLGLILVALAVFALPGLLDRLGWRVRLGMAWLAAEQRRRAAGPRLPRTPAGADRWLDRSEAGEAGLTRASVLLTAGRVDEARALVEAFVPTTAEDGARVARMRAAIDGLDRGVVDRTEADAAIAALPAELQRYHRLSLAWSIAWVDVSNGRPWRDGFAAAAAGLRWAGIPARFRVIHGLQQFAVLVAGAVLVAVLAVIGALS